MSIEAEQFNLKQILFYHLIVGLPVLIITVLFYFINTPIMLSIMYAIILGIVPTQIYIMFKYAKKQNKNIFEIILYKNKIAFKDLIKIYTIVFLISFTLYGIFSGLEHYVFDNFINKNYRILPQDFILYKFDFNLVDENTKKLILLLNLLCNGLVAPIVEEFYFRGFLLPRMTIFKNKAALVNTVLFSIYHFISPYELITRVVSFLPISYTVWKKEDIRISILVHCSINTFGAVMLIIAML